LPWFSLLKRTGILLEGCREEMLCKKTIVPLLYQNTLPNSFN